MASTGLGVVLWLSAPFSAALTGQAPLPIVDDERIEERIVAACAVRRAAGELVPCATLVTEATTARVADVATATPNTGVLPGPDLFDRLLPSIRIVGHYYLCSECDEWHFSGSSAFCVAAAGVVATCAHVLAADETMREAFLVVADLRGNVWPVERVLAADAAADVCIVKTGEKDCVPLPLRGGVRTGERVYCLSHPDHQFAFFSEGVVARWYGGKEPVDRAGEPIAPTAAPLLPWLHVTCDFARGSSGAPIVDACGNVVGIAQSTTTVVHDEDAVLLDTQMVFKTAAPAVALQALLRNPAAGERPVR